MDAAEGTDKEEEEGGGKKARGEKMGHFKTFAKKNNPGTDCLIISICLAGSVGEASDHFSHLPILDGG